MIKILFHVKTALVLHIRCCPYLGTINKYINSIILNRFYWWSKTLPHPLFLTNNIKIDGISIKLKWETHNLFTLNFKFWRYIDYNNLWHIYSPSIFISCFTLAFTSADLILCSFSDYHSTLATWKKNFCHKFSYWKVL